MSLQNNVNVTVDFWLVKMPVGVTFETIIQEIAKLPDDEQRNVTKIDNQPVRMTKIKQNGFVWSGDMVKIRMDYLPSKANIDGHLEPLDLDDDEGIGEENAFIYNSAYNVLIMQRNRHGVSATLFAYYLSKKLSHLMSRTDEVELLPVVRPEGVENLNKLFEVRRFEVGFAYSGDLRNVIDSESITSGIQMIEQLQSMNGSFIFSMGRKKGGMSLKEVIKAAISLYRNSNQVTRLKVSGLSTDSPDETIEYDVLEYRLKYKSVLTTNHRRELTYEQRSNLLYKAMAEKELEIREILK